MRLQLLKRSLPDSALENAIILMTESGRFCYFPGMSQYQLQTPRQSDFEFIKRVHHVTLREHVEKIWGWNEPAQDAFVQEDFESGEIQLIRSSKDSVGYLQVSRKDGVLNIVNILLLPEFQNRQLGSAIIKDLIVQSKTEKLSLRLGVFKVNHRAKSLYDKLGFKTYAETETHFLMQFVPE